MPNSVQAAAEGLPKISRRLFLRNSAAAGAVLATVTAPVVADAKQEEHPAIIEAGERLPRALERLRVADQAKADALAHYYRIAPELPDELVHKGRYIDGQRVCERETDPEGNTIWPESMDGKTCRPPRLIYSAHAISISSVCKDRTSKVGRHWLRLQALAEKYETGLAAAREAANLDAAIYERQWAVDALQKLSWEVATVVPNSLTGLVIKARIMNAFASCDELSRTYAMATMQRMPSDILALFGGEAS